MKSIISKTVSPFIMVAPFAAAGLLTVYAGRLTGDEGWYAYAAASVMKGQQPYRDFLFTQTPLMPYVYGPFLALFGHSLLVARWLSFLFALGAALMLLRLCARRAGPSAAWIAGLLLCLNLNLVADVSVVKTQALTVLLTMAGVAFAAVERVTFGSMLLSVLCMTLAVLTRLSVLPALGLLWMWLLVYQPRPVWKPLAAAVGSAALLAAAWRWFDSDGNLRFGIYDFHRVYYQQQEWTPAYGWFFLKGFFLNQAPILACFAGAVVLFCRDCVRAAGARRDWFRRSAVPLYCLLAYLATTLVHATRAIAYPTYQTSNVAFVLVFTALVLGRALEAQTPRLRTACLWGVGILALAGISTQEYSFCGKGDGSLARMREAVAVIQRISGGHGSILTLNTELALESGLPVLPGYELSEFSYFSRMDDATAVRLHVANANSVLQDLREQRAGIVCLTARDMGMLGASGYGEAYGQIVDQDYVVRDSIPGYGQFFDTLYVLTPKEAKNR